MKIFKNSVIVLLLLFAAGHLAFTISYTLPEDLVPPVVKRKSVAYCEPFFTQGWALFAPAPEVSKKIYVSYLQQDGQWSGWEAPFDKYLFGYQANRASANSKIVLSLNSTLHYLYQEYKTKFEKQNNNIDKCVSGIYNVLRFEAQRELAGRNINVNEIRLLVVYKEAKCGSEKMHTIYFPGSAVAK